MKSAPTTAAAKERHKQTFTQSVENLTSTGTTLNFYLGAVRPADGTMHVERGRSQFVRRRGTTLVELMVAITAGVVVLAAISAVAIVALRETARVKHPGRRNPAGPQVLDQVIEELHSACVAPEIAPVQRKQYGGHRSDSSTRRIGSRPDPDPQRDQPQQRHPLPDQLRRHWRLGTRLDLVNPLADVDEADDQRQPHSPEQLDLQLLLLLQRRYLRNPSGHAAQRSQADDHDRGPHRPHGRLPKPHLSKTANAAANVQDSALLRFTPPPTTPGGQPTMPMRRPTSRAASPDRHDDRLSLIVPAGPGGGHRGQRRRQLTRHDLAQKQAYEAAKAGIDDYAFHLNAENSYWTHCAEVPAPSAVNPKARPQSGARARRHRSDLRDRIDPRTGHDKDLQCENVWQQPPRA